MKVLGTSFFEKKQQTKVVFKKGNSYVLEHQDFLGIEEQYVRALALPLGSCKIRFYPTPPLSPSKLKKVLETRILQDPMLDSEKTKFSFKKVNFGAEVHFVDQDLLNPHLENFEWIVSPHQALFRYLTDYVRFFEPCLLIFKEKKAFYCFRYDGRRIDRYFESNSMDPEQIQNTLNNLKIDKVVLLNRDPVESFLPFEIELENQQWAFSIGSAIEGLDPEQNVSFSTPIDNPSFCDKLYKKGSTAFFLTSILAFLMAVFFHQILEKEKIIYNLSIEKTKDLEPFVPLNLKTSPKISIILRDLLLSIEPYKLDLVEFDTKVHMLEKKPYLQIAFSLEGDPVRIENYEQSVKKAGKSLFAKMERVPESKNFYFRVSAPIQS